MKYSLISADTHMDLVYMPPEVFVENAPSHLRHMMPHVEDTDDGPFWMQQGDRVVPSGFGGAEQRRVQGRRGTAPGPYG